MNLYIIKYPFTQKFLQAQLGTFFFKPDLPLRARRDKYLTTWGSLYGGYCNPDGTLYLQGAHAYYWSNTANNGYGRHAYCLHFDNYNVHTDPQQIESTSKGFVLRCVRDL